MGRLITCKGVWMRPQPVIAITALLLALLPAAGPAWAVDATAEQVAQARFSERLIGAALIEEVQRYISSDIVVVSLRSSNTDRANLSPSEVRALDARWRGERDEAVHPLVASTLASPVSAYLLRLQAASGGLFTEIILVDGTGLNVGQSSVTADMWQGDEAKFQKTYEVGPGAVFIDAAEWHEASRTWRSQLNLTVDDPKTGEPIGAATFEVNLTELARRTNR